MSIFTGTIAIVGAGKGGSALLSILASDTDISIIGIADNNPMAPGLQTANQLNIFTTSDFRELLAKSPDIVINVTGRDDLDAEFLKYKSPETRIIDGKSARLIWDLVDKRRQARDEVKLLLEETRELYRIGVALTSSEKLDAVLETLLLEALRTLRAPAGSIALYDESTGYLNLAASMGFSEGFSQVSTWKRRGGGMTDHILRKRIPTIISDVAGHSFVDNAVLLKEGIRSIAAVPLFANDHITGILYIDDFRPRVWSEREIEFITLLGIQAAYAIEKFKAMEIVYETKTYLKNVLNNSADIIVTTDTDGRIVEFNSGASRVLGYSLEEIAGTLAEDLWVEPEARHFIMGKLKEDGFVANHETRLKTKDGRIIDVSLTISYIRNGSGKIYGTVGISKDITEKKRLEKAIELRNLELQELNERLEEKVFDRTKDLEKANRELEQSSRLKSQFISTMSHELRTPLNSILGFSNLLADEVFGSLTDKQKRHVANINNSGSHLLQLINNILDIAKIESGKMELHYEDFDASLAIAEVESIIQPLAERKKQKILLNLSEPTSFIRADRIKFKQILYNLLSNAVKFSPENENIRLSTEIIDSRKGGRVSDLTTFPGIDASMKLSVTDSGIGIKKEHHEMIFSEFVQVDGSFSRRYEGTGLGLALTKRLVELHGGEIFLKSKEGLGSTFTIVLPLLDSASRVQDVKPQHVEIEDIADDLSFQKERRSDAPLILVVEDDPATAELLMLYLAQGGYRVAHTGNGDNALNRIREIKPFLVVLDVMLPGKDGWEILNELKSDPEIKHIPVIVSSVIDNRELGIALGASDYLVKPLNKCSLLKKLQDFSFPAKKAGKTVNILCIDDHNDVLELLTSYLEPEGYSVITANEGRKGFEKAVTYKPDLIILDLMMPELDGFEVAFMLRSNPVTMDVPILILTAKDLTMDDRLRLAGKVESFVQKSHFTKEDLLMHVRDLEVTYARRAGFLDEVSGLFDHSYFQLRLAQEVSRSERYKDTLTVLMLDLDHFTEYINAYGTQRADICIKKIAGFLCKTLRGSDIVVRYGVDEFALILSDTQKKQAEFVAQRILAYIDTYPFFGEEVMPQGKITASIAVVNYPQDASAQEEIIFKAHKALRKAKAEGGSKIEVYEHS
ncbi:MAG: response regulator [Nitrospirae bacterium]|nr:response regulator [Nitrospirota bacterium]